MLPMIVLGASIGVMLNKILPSYIIAILLALLLCYVSVTTLLKIMAMVRMEREKFGPVSCLSKKKSQGDELTANKIEMATRTHRKALPINKVDIIEDPLKKIEVNPEQELK